MKKNVKTILRYSLYAFIGIVCLLGGIVYSRFSRDGMPGIFSIWNLLSQTVNEKKPPVEVPKIPSMTVEQINARIDMLQKEIVEETNDPDRNMELRRELYKLKQQLTGQGQ
jgi:hypothetical protein